MCVCLPFIRLTPIIPGLPGPAKLLFNGPSRGIMLRFSRPPIGCDNDESNHFVLIKRQPQASEDVNTKGFVFFPQDHT